MQKKVLDVLINLWNNKTWDLAVPLASGIYNNPELFTMQKLISIENFIKLAKNWTKDKKKIKEFEKALEQLKTIKELEQAEKKQENVESLLNYL